MCQDDILTLHLRVRQLRALEDMLEQLFCLSAKTASA